MAAGQLQAMCVEEWGTHRSICRACRLLAQAIAENFGDLHADPIPCLVGGFAQVGTAFNWG